jgi:hypothetical protein
MKAKLGPVLIAGYGNWDMGDGPVTNKDGEIVENVQVIDLDGEDISRYTMGHIAEADRPKVMSQVYLIGDLAVAQKVRKAGDSNLVVDVLKLRVSGFEPYVEAASGSRATKPTAVDAKQNGAEKVAA